MSAAVCLLILEKPGSMVAIICMSVVMHPAKPEIHYMAHHYQHHCKWQQPVLVAVPDLFCKQQRHARRKYGQRPKAMMMLSISVP